MINLRILEALRALLFPLEWAWAPTRCVDTLLGTFFGVHLLDHDEGKDEDDADDGGADDEMTSMISMMRMTVVMMIITSNAW